MNTNSGEPSPKKICLSRGPNSRLPIQMTSCFRLGPRVSVPSSTNATEGSTSVFRVNNYGINATRPYFAAGDTSLTGTVRDSTPLSGNASIPDPSRLIEFQLSETRVTRSADSPNGLFLTQGQDSTLLQPHRVLSERTGTRSRQRRVQLGQHGSRLGMDQAQRPLHNELEQYGPETACIIKARKVLVDDFQERNSAAAAFPPVLTDSSTRKAIGRFQTHINETSANLQKVCSSCGLFTASEKSQGLSEIDLLYRQSIEANILVEADLDRCGMEAGSFLLCDSCISMVHKSRFPKLGSINEVNTTPCHRYPAVLDDLTPVEQAVIALAHPVVSILKLRPIGGSPTTCYRGIRGHAVVLPQNPGPLLDILPSRSLVLHDVIRIVWASEKPHNTLDLHPFALIRKQKVLAALQWLRENNPLYGDIVIDHALLETWRDEFVPIEISERVLQCGSDHTEKQGYAADLEAENLEDDFQASIATAGLDSSGLLGGCLYTDANNTREHPTSRLLSAVSNYKRSQESADAGVPVVIYEQKGNALPLNDWDNPNFFTAAFPTLFPFGVGGHGPKGYRRKIPLSLEEWAHWSLLHHSRRYVPIECSSN